MSPVDLTKASCSASSQGGIIGGLIAAMIITSALTFAATRRHYQHELTKQRMSVHEQQQAASGTTAWQSNPAVAVVEGVEAV